MRVQEQVDEDLLDVARDPDDRGELAVLLHEAAARPDLVEDEALGGVDGPREVDRPRRVVVVASEEAKIPDDRRDAVDPRAHLRDERCLARAHTEGEHVRGEADEGERVVDLVGDAGGHRPQSREAIGVRQLRPQSRALRHVTRVGEDGGGAFEVDDRRRDLGRDLAPVAPPRGVVAWHEALAGRRHLLDAPLHHLHRASIEEGHRLADELRHVVVPEQARGGRVRVEHDAVARHDDRVRGVLDEGAEPVFGHRVYDRANQCPRTKAK